MRPISIEAGGGRPVAIRNGNILFKAIGSQTDDQIGIFQQTMNLDAPGPVPHFHKKTTEMFYILEGALKFRLAGEESILEKDAFALVPPNTVHSFSQHGPIPTRFLIIFTPGMKREEFFEGLERIARKDGPSNQDELIALMEKYDQFLADENESLANNY